MAKKVIIEVEIEGTQEVLKLQNQIKATKKELKETKDIKAYDNLSADLVRLQSNLKEARKQQRQAVDAFTATDEGVGAYSRLSAQLRVARNRLKDLKAEGVTTGNELEELTNEVNRLDTSLKDIDRSVGQTNREVGAYEEAVRKAVGITDAQTGAFTRLEGKAKILRRTYKDLAASQGANSKEARQLKKELEKVEKQLKATGTQASRTGGRIGGIRNQLRSLGPAFAGIASGFLIFAELPQAFADVTEGLQSVGNLLSPTIALNDALNTSIEESIDGYVDERLELENLFTTATADNATRDEKTAAIDLINEQYGQYLPSLLTEKSTLEEIAIAQKLATNALIENIAARASREKLESDIKRLAQAEAATIEIEAAAESTLGSIADGVSRVGNAIFTLGSTEIFGVGQAAQISSIQEGLNDVEKSAAKAAIASGPEFKERFTSTLFEVEDALKESFANAGEIGAEEAGNAAEKAGNKARQVANRIAKEQERALQKRLKDQQRVLAELIKNEAQADLLLNKLEEQAIKQGLESQEEGQKRALDLEANASRLRIESLEAQQAKFIESAKAQQAKVNAAFGEGSKEALRAQENLGKQRLQITTTTDTLIEQETTASAKRRVKIKKDFNTKEAQEAKKALQERLTELQAEQTAIVSAAEQEQLKIRELRAKGQIDAQEADKRGFDARVKALKGQIAQLNQQEFALIGEEGFGTEVAQEEFDKIASARQALNTQLAELDEEQTAKSVEESKKRGDKIREDFEKAAGAFSQAVGLVGQIADLANQKVIERIEKDQEEQAASLEALEERLQTASGLEAKFLEEEIAREEKAAEDLAQKKIRAEKEALIAKKAVSITEAVINTALAISSALTAGPPLGFILAGLAGALGAVQIATIAAQPVGALGGIEGESFARGGMVVGRSHAQGGEKFAVGGRVVELEGGEAVINKRSTSRYRNQLSEINAAGGGVRFQAGGITGAPMQAPRIAKEFDSQGSLQAVVEQNSQLLRATNSRIDRITVEYTTATEEAINEDKADRKQIQATATL